MPDEEKQEQETPAAVEFTNSMTEAIIETSKQYVNGYKFVLIGYKPDSVDRNRIDAAIGTNLNPPGVLRTLKAMIQIMEQSIERGSSFVVFPNTGGPHEG